MIIVLQITDLLFKYASQEPMYIFKYFIERACQYYWKKVGDVILYVPVNSVPKKTNPKRHMEPESSNQKLVITYTATKGSKESCSKNNKKINRLEVAENSIIVAEEIIT